MSEAIVPAPAAAQQHLPLVKSTTDVFVKEGTHIIICENHSRYSFIKVTATGTAKIGRKNNVKVAPLIGCPFGSFFELEGTTLVRVERSRLQEDDAEEAAAEASAEPEKLPDNRALVDDNQAQTLSAEEITRLKQEGGRNLELVKAIAQGSATFEKKTAFSKAKYLKKKKQKHMVVIEVLRPTSRTLCEAYFAKNPSRINFLRVDTLSQIMLHSDVRSGQKVAIYDRTTGLIVGAFAERLSGFGKLINLHRGPHPNYSIVEHFNFTEEQKGVIQSLSLDRIDAEPTTFTAKPGDTEEYSAKRRKVVDAENSIRDELFAKCDALIIIPSESENPADLLRSFYRFLAPGASFCVYSPFLQALAEAQAEMNRAGAAVHYRLSECWYRVHQVLPMRTHPMMQMSGAGGFILTGYKVLSTWGEDQTINPSTSSPSTTDDAAPKASEDEDAMAVDDGDDHNNDVDDEGEPRKEKKRARSE